MLFRADSIRRQPSPVFNGALLNSLGDRTDSSLLILALITFVTSAEVGL